MSGYYGYPAAAGFCLPQQQLPPSAMTAAAAAVTGGGYPMIATMPQMPPQPPLPMPAAVAPAAIPYMPSAYTGVYGAAAPVQPMAYAMNQVPQQQQVPMFQQTAVYQPPPLPLQPPPMPLQQQQPAWQPVQSSSTSALSNYRQQHQPQYQGLAQQHRPSPQQQSAQHQGPFRTPQQQLPPRPQQAQQQPLRPQQNQQQPPRPQQNQQQPPRPQQNQQQPHRQQQNQQQPPRPQQNQQQPPRPQQNQQQPPRPQQQVQRPPFRPRVPTAAGQRAPFPPTQRPTAPGSGASAATPRPPLSSPIGRMRPPSQQQRQPPPLFGKPNLRAVPSTPGSATPGNAASAAGRMTLAATSNTGNDTEELQHCPPIPGGVGTEYVVQIRTDQRGAAALQYQCRLCDCRFTDIQARDMHVKGRRHRLQFKRKVDPRLSVDAKPAIMGRRGGLSTQDSVAAAVAAVPSETATEAANRRRREEEQRLRDMQELEWSNYAGCKHGGFWGGGAGQPRRPESNDDRQVLAKHSSVYPTEAELHAVQQLVTRCERALKLASDQLSSEAEAPVSAPLRGVMRVGALAKGLLLHGDLATQLVLLCAAWPTKDLRERIIQLLPERLESSTASADLPSDEQQQQQQQIQVRLDEDEGCILVQDSTAANGGGLELTCSVYLTSPAVREEAGADNPEPEGALDRDKCLEALAALRQAKWFQAKASSLQSCVPVIRVLRDMCQRLPIWAPLSEWAMELLVERSISSASGGQLLSPGEAVRRVMECLASGILLPGGPGLRDPCEKAPVDAAASMTAQEREDITASAQQALRLIAFRQLHRVLDMAPLVPPPSAAAPAAGAEVINTQTVAAPKRPAAVAAGPDLNAKQARLT